MFGQQLFERAEVTHGLTDSVYVAARITARRPASAEEIDRLLRMGGSSRG